MSNAKRFLSVILAMILTCSTLVVGASATYHAYKNEALNGQYNSLDKPVLTTEQYASAAMDEVDRMLNKEQISLNVYVGDLNLTSVDAAMDSVYNLVNSKAFDFAKGMLGDLKDLNVNAFQPVEKGGVRRSASSNSDVDIIYAVLQLLYDNKDLIVRFINGNLDLGSIVSSLVDISEFSDVNKLLKGMLYESVYNEDAPANIATYSIDSMVQTLIDNLVIPLVPELEGHTNVSTGTAYNFVDEALKTLYNTLLLDLLNDNVKYEINKFCGVVYTKNDQGEIVDTDKSNLNSYASLINIDYQLEAYDFAAAGGTFIDNINNILKSVLDKLLNSSVYVWQAGDNSKLITNITGLAKAILINTGDEFFASYIKVATPDEINAMTSEQLCTYALRAIINSSVNGMYIPDSVTTLRGFGYSALTQLLATSVPQLDFSSLPKNSTDTLVIMGIDYAIYSVNSALDMGLSYVTTMDGVDAQITKAINYAIDNYGGLLNGVKFDTSSSASGWSNLNTLIFSIINKDCLPAAANQDIKTLVIDCIIDNILDLDFTSMLDMLDFIPTSELSKSMKQVILNVVTRIVNIIFPGAIASATSFDAIATNSALANTVNAIFTDLSTYKAQLVAAILPTLCDILELTSTQEFKFPDITYDELVYDASGSPDFKIKLRNSSTGINTGYTWYDSNGDKHFTQDKLYTYDVKSVTSNISTLNLTNPGKIAGGEEGEIRVTGSFTDSVFVVAITYDVLTEDGTPLTSEPITEYVYSYLSKSAASDDTTKMAVTNGSLAITDGQQYVYANGMNDLYNMQITLENSSFNTYDNVVPTTTLLSKLVTKDNICYLKLKDSTTTLLPATPDENGNVASKGIAKTYIIQTTEEYDALTAEEKEAVWNSMVEKGQRVNASTGAVAMYTRYTAQTIGAVVNGTQVATTNAQVFLYNDYDLGSILSSEMGKHRQASGYSDANAWATYTTAMQNAAKAVYSPFKNGTFAAGSATSGKAVLYKPAYEALTAAIEALDACEISAGVASTQQIMDGLAPSNEGKEYDDSDYNFFGVSDFAAYTYYNYRTEAKSAQSMINDATIPDKETGETKVVNALTLAYTNHRLSLYAGRLIPVLADKSHLVAAINNAVPTADESKYSVDSWANYIRAYNFAVLVNNEAIGTSTNPILRQSKVNTAMEELVEAQKRLVAPTGSGEEPVFTPVNPAGEETAPEIIETVDGLVLGGVYGGEQFDPADYFDCTGCNVESTSNDLGNISTGAVVTIKNSSTGAVIATYTICVTGDIDGDTNVDSNDTAVGTSIAVGVLDSASVQQLAMDVNNDTSSDSDDVLNLSKVAAGIASIDYANRVVA